MDYHKSMAEEFVVLSADNGLLVPRSPSPFCEGETSVGSSFMSSLATCPRKRVTKISALLFGGGIDVPKSRLNAFKVIFEDQIMIFLLVFMNDLCIFSLVFVND